MAKSRAVSAGRRPAKGALKVYNHTVKQDSQILRERMRFGTKRRSRLPGG